MFDFLVPVGSAAFVASRNAVIRGLRQVSARRTVLFASFGGTALLALPVLAFALPVQVEPAFYWAVPLAATALVLGRLSLIKALSSSELSATVPLIAFAPLFITVTSFLVLGERPTALGIAGLAAIVAGSYLLRIQSIRDGLLQPFRVLAREPGARLMLLAAACFSIAAPFAKLAMRSSSTYAAFGAAQVVGFAIVFVWVTSTGSFRSVVRQIRRHPGRLAAAGALNFLQAITTYIAFDLMLVAYATGIKGSNILMSAILGHVVFKEGRVAHSLAVAGVMVAGVVLLALS